MYEINRPGGTGVLPPRPQPMPTPPPMPTGRPHRVGRVMNWVSLVISSVALLCAVAALVLAWPEKEPEVVPEDVIPAPEIVEPEPMDYIFYRGKDIPVQENVARNALHNSGLSANEQGWLTYTWGDTIGAIGIDVSSHQGEINWREVAQSGVEFAMIRVGYRGYGEEGKLVLDSNYARNIEGALAAGLDVGVYFFSQATSIWEVEEELEMLMDAIRGYEIKCPVVFDWEHIANSNSSRTKDVSGTAITRMADFFCHQVEEAGYTPAVYFNKDLAYLYLDLERLEGRTFWLAEYATQPEFYYRFEMWQYTSRGKVPGIEGDVDLNLYFRTPQEEPEQTA